MKDRMIEAVERGFTTEDNAYEYVRESMADAADQERKAAKEDPLPVFRIGDRVVWNDPADDLGDLYGVVTRADVGADWVMVKLDTGGTFEVEREFLRRER